LPFIETSHSPELDHHLPGRGEAPLGSDAAPELKIEGAVHPVEGGLARHDDPLPGHGD